jgi:hypothetical protein
VRTAWGWRTELALGIGAGLLVRLGDILGPGGGILLLGLAGVALWRTPSLSRQLAARLQRCSERRWVTAALNACGVVGPWGGRPRIQAITSVPVGLRVEVRTPLGHHSGHLVEAALALEAAMRVQEVRVTRRLEDASLAQLLIVCRDPFALGPPLAWPWSNARRTSAWDPFPLGVDENGATTHLALGGHNLLLGGEPGAGKSGALNLVVAAAALDPATSLTIFDGKEVELAAWEPCAETFCGPDMAGAVSTLECLCAEMDRRYGEVRRLGLRKVTPDVAALHVVVIDELAFYLRAGSKAERNAFHDALHNLVSRGRAAGMVVAAATQKPGSDIVPTWIRDLFSFRLAFRCTTPEASDTVLGQGWASRGYSAATITGATRGVGFLLAEGALPVKLRCFYLTDAEVRAICAGAAMRRSRP